jgi:hypothetical protein
MIKDKRIISTVKELEAFLQAIDSGMLGLNGAAGVAMATNNSDGRRFVAVLDENHQLLIGRWVTEEVFLNGQDLVRQGAPKH